MTRLAWTAAALVAAAQLIPAAEKEPRVFELRTYAVAADEMDAFDAVMKETVSKAFAESGAKPLGYFRSLDPKAGVFVALLCHADAAAYEKSRTYLNNAVKDLAVRAGQPLDKAFKGDVTLLTATDYSPEVEPKKADPARVFELRTYTTTPGNLPALDSRFRDHTRELFKSHGMTNLWYFHRTEGKAAGETLVYFLAHDSAAARDKSFAEFRVDPKWTAALKASEAKAGSSLTAKDGVKSLMLKPTGYSPIQ